jgi:hypothetical protein
VALPPGVSTVAFAESSLRLTSTRRPLWRRSSPNGYVPRMFTDLGHSFPEWEPFADAVAARSSTTGTWCEAWTTRDVVIHQVGNAEELTRVLEGHLKGHAVETRSFEEREAPYHAVADGELWSTLVSRMEHLADVSETAETDLGPNADVAWTGRIMKVAWFAEHMREELVLHRWDMTGDDVTAREALAEPWMTKHSVVAVGSPLLRRGVEQLDLKSDERMEGRLRSPGRDDVLVSADGGTGTGTIELVPAEGPSTVECDPASRVLLLWGRRPADHGSWSSDAGPEALRQLRGLLAGY